MLEKKIIKRKLNFLKIFSMLRYKNMGGGLMQLVAYGIRDIYLTGNPQITSSRLSTADTPTFSMETIQQTIRIGTPSDGGTSTVSMQW